MSGNNWAWQNSGNGSSGTLSSGSIVIGTANTLATLTGANTFQVSVDLSNMANGDIVDIQIFRIINSSAILMEEGIYSNIQANPLVTFGPFAANGTSSGLVVKLNQTAGTARNYDWEVLADSSNAPAVVNSVAAAATNFKKDTAITAYPFLMTDSTNHNPKTGIGSGVTAQRSIDGGAFASCTNTPAELADGIYTLAVSAADVNGNFIIFRMSASGADDTFFTIATQP
jgi:hypothetical protein